MLFSTLAQFSCIKSLDEIGWQADYKLPILVSQLGVDDIFTDTLLVFNPDSSVHLRLEQKITAFDGSDFLDFNDTIATEIFNIPFVIKVNPGQKILENQGKLVMSLDDILLEKAVATNAQMKIFFRNTIKQKLRVQFEVISATKNGVSFVVTEDVPAATTAGASVTEKTINLLEYVIDFTGENHNEFNAIISKTTIWLHPDADTTAISASDTVSFTTVFEKLEVENVHGFFGQHLINTSENSSQSTFNHFTAGDFFLDEITASLEITNNVGVDARLKINDISSFNSKTGKNISLDHEIIGNYVNIKRATLVGNSAEGIIPSSYSFDLSNAKVKEMIENMPNQLNFDISTTLNPLGNASAGHDFFFAGKPIEASVIIDLPLKVKLDSLTIQNYSKIEFDPEGKIKKGEFIVMAENGFPFDVEIQFYLLDENRNVKDSLFENNIKVASALVDNNGIVTTAQKSVLPAEIPEIKMEVLRQTKEVLVKARLMTDGNTRYPILSGYNIDIKLIADVSYEF